MTVLNSTEHAFAALRIEGGLLPPAFLQRIAALGAPAQTAADYGVPKGLTLRDEIGRYWRIAGAAWAEYRQARERVDRSPEKIGVEIWLGTLLRRVLGFEDLTLVPGAKVRLGERSFPITHRAHGEAVPLLLTTHGFDLDRADPRFGDEGRRRAPHAAIQEFLNADTKAVWGLVGNGAKLRLVRDNPSLTRPAFVEVDLERMFEEELFPDFAAFWLTFHASRLQPRDGAIAGCPLERWREVAHETGERALQNLRAGVTTALRELGSGFVQHPANEELRRRLRSGELTAEGLFAELLRLVYRLLLLLTAEDRDLLHDSTASPEARRLYQEGYSIGRLRDLARLRRHHDPRYADLWEGLLVVFGALGARGALALGLPALGGLFDCGQCRNLDAALLPNDRLLRAVHALGFFQADGTLARVNYRDMDTEELGSVYESLLELHPVVDVEAAPWRFGFVGDEAGGAVAGSERKLSGSYYTPDALVQELLRTALEPVIVQTLEENRQDPRTALLRLRVLDPACGSGHFLLGAARRLAAEVAKLDAAADVPDEAVRRHALREIVRHCIYGIDKNPLAVELCKTALWIETIEPGKPLGFLDAHIRCGDSLIGVMDLGVLQKGIPDEAFKPLTGDDKAYARELLRRNRDERGKGVLGQSLNIGIPAELTRALEALSREPEDAVEQVEAKRRRLDELRVGYDLKVACDLWCAAFFASKSAEAKPSIKGRELVPTSYTVWSYLRSPSTVYGPLVGAVSELADRHGFFHWPLKFPDVFAAGGFDVVLGNPPWERIKLQEQEFFAARHEGIAEALNKAARERLIRALASSNNPADRKLHAAFAAALHAAEAQSGFVRGGGRFPLTAVGDVNTYALFAELFLRLTSERGRAGVIVPTGIATDSSTKAFFDAAMSRGRLFSLFDFENREGLFPAVDSRMKFSLLTLAAGVEATRFAFFLTAADQLADPRRRFTLSAEDIALINPNTRTCPIFRTERDAELTRKIYRRVPVLIDKEKGKAGNPWGIKLRTMFHKTNDDKSLHKRKDLAAKGPYSGAFRHRLLPAPAYSRCTRAISVGSSTTVMPRSRGDLSRKLRMLGNAILPTRLKLICSWSHNSLT